jgi:polar amino acid transport system substrate-binding protein
MTRCSERARRRPAARVTVAVVAAIVALITSACGSSVGVAAITAGPAAPRPLGATIAAPSTSAGAAAASCDPTASIAPDGPLPVPGSMPANTTMAKIKARGRLIVGVDQNTYLFGFRNPQTGQLEGFDIDIAKAIAKAIFGDPDKIEFKVLSSAQRIPALQNNAADPVDIVVRTFSITCDRKQQIAFSSVYYQAQQRILASANSGISGAADLGGRTVCATAGSTSLAHLLALKPAPKVLVVTDWTDCLVAIQQGQADAVSTDDSILLGLKAQDPNLKLVGTSLSPEPYGIGIRKDETDMVRFVNGVLAQLRSDGQWKQIYATWLGSADVPQPPTAKYTDQ